MTYFRAQPATVDGVDRVTWDDVTRLGLAKMNRKELNNVCTFVVLTENDRLWDFDFAAQCDDILMSLPKGSKQSKRLLINSYL